MLFKLMSRLEVLQGPMWGHDVQVLDEIGVDVSAQMGSAPTKKVGAKQQVTTVQQDEENNNLTARLAALK